MLDLKHEDLITISEASKIVNPSNPPHVSSIWRWFRFGVRGVKLQSIIIGGRRLTSRAAITRFLVELNRQDTSPSPAPSRAAQEANNRLSKAGV